MTWTLVLLGGAVGAPLRYLIDQRVTARRSGRFPWGTLTANLLACALLGFVASLAGVSPDVVALLGTGVAGALSTYSTFGFEIVRLAETRAARTAWAYALVSVVLGVLVALLAGAIARGLG
jgi:CrcB protein